MKPKRLRFFFLFVVPLLLLFSSCATEYFHTPNDLSGMKGTVYLRDGSQKQGTLTVLFENGVLANPFSICIIPSGSGKKEYVPFTGIASYVINGETFVPKRINLYTAGIHHDLFVKRLSDASAKIQLYELPQNRKSNDMGEETAYYFISVPSYSSTELIELHSNLLVPAFEEKMSAFVADCPTLAAKIKAQESGYSYVYLSPQTRKVDVMKKIIQEYSNCSAK